MTPPYVLPRPQLPRRYSDLFDPRIPGFSFGLPAAIFFGLLLGSFVYGFVALLGGDRSYAEFFFTPSVLSGRVIDSAIGAFAFTWASRRMRSAWEASIGFGAMGIVAGLFANGLGDLLRSRALSWPSADPRNFLTEMIWAFAILGGAALGVRLGLGSLGGVPLIVFPARLGAGLLFMLIWSGLSIGGLRGFFRLQMLAANLANGVLMALALWLGLLAQRGRNQRYRLPTAPPPRRPWISEGFFVLGWAVPMALSLALLLPLSDRENLSGRPERMAVLAIAALLLMLLAAVVFLILIHKMWSAIQDGYARTTPGQAVGFLFIPFFNIYWIFQVLWGFARDYNAYLARYALPARRLPGGLFLAYAILTPLAWIPYVGPFTALANYFLAVLMLDYIAKALNALPRAALGPAPPPGL